MQLIGINEAALDGYLGLAVCDTYANTQFLMRKGFNLYKCVQTISGIVGKLNYDDTY